MKIKQTKSKERISKFAEVNTSEKETKAMLDLVKHESEKIDSKFLEPACGDGNFLVEILERKSKTLTKKFKKNQYEFHKNTIVLFGSIYGIDILEDNVLDARIRLFENFFKTYKELFPDSLNKNLLESIKFILGKNIIHGDSLNFKNPNTKKPIIFSEWSMVGAKVKRRDFVFQELVNYTPYGEETLFSDLGEKAIIWSPVKKYPLTKFDEIFKKP